MLVPRRPAFAGARASSHFLIVASAVGVFCASPAGRANYLDEVGLTALRAELGAAIPTGAGVTVSQIEANVTTGASYLPDVTSPEFVGKTITGKSGTSVISSHANSVATFFFGRFSSLAPDVATVDVYEANAWIASGFLRLGTFIAPQSETRLIQNHSWIGSLTKNNAEDVASETEALRRFDYVIQQSDILASVGLNNGSGTPIPPLLASAYNVISVGLTDGNHSTGTATIDPITAGDPGRVKPEIVAPALVTSFATPLVGSAGALLRQAAPTAGRHSVSLKAMLLAGATKEQFANWNRTSTRPLDAHFGAGQLNVWQSYRILAAGQQSASGVASVAKRGWDYNTTATSARQYFFDLPASDGPSRFSAALTWNRVVTDNPGGSWSPNVSLANLSLRIFAATGFTKGALVDESVSPVDNVEHLHTVALAPGRYVMEVTSTQSAVAYGLAWNSATSVAVVASTPEASEFAQSAGVFTITRTGDLSAPLTVAYSVGGTALPGTDYSPLPSTVTIPANVASVTVNVAPLSDANAEGDETVTLTLGSGLASTFSEARATVTLHDRPLDAWRFSHFTAAELADSAVSGDLADFDRDGAANIAEYALGLDPKVPDPNALPVPTVNASGFPELTFQKSSTATDVVCVVEFSTNFTTWTTLTTVQPSALALALAAGTDAKQTVSTTSNSTTAAEPIQFLRLRVTRQ